VNINEMIIYAQRIQKAHGDLPIVGGYMSDDESPTSLLLVDEHGVNVILGNPRATGVFIE